MFGFAFAGFSIYLFLKKNPNESATVLNQARDIIKYMPMGSSSIDMLTPFTDFSNSTSFIP